MNYIIWFLNRHLLHRLYCRCGCGQRITSTYWIREKYPVPRYSSGHNPFSEQFLNNVGRGNPSEKFIRAGQVSSNNHRTLGKTWKWSDEQKSRQRLRMKQWAESRLALRREQK